MGLDALTPNPRKNSEVATDSESNAYHIWTGADQGIYMARSTDSGDTWDSESIRISPAGVISTTFPQTDAGDPEELQLLTLEVKMYPCSIRRTLTATIGMEMAIMRQVECITTFTSPTV